MTDRFPREHVTVAGQSQCGMDKIDSLNVGHTTSKETVSQRLNVRNGPDFSWPMRR
jgi:hypothetical protein